MTMFIQDVAKKNFELSEVPRYNFVDDPYQEYSTLHSLGSYQSSKFALTHKWIKAFFFLHGQYIYPPAAGRN